MPESLQFPIGAGLLILPVLTGGILAVWSRVIVRDPAKAARPAMFLGILVPAVVVGLLAASAGIWHAPRYDAFDLPHDERRDFQSSLFLAFVASLAIVPIGAKMTPALMLAAARLRQSQLTLALLVAAVGLAGPLIFFLYALLHGPAVLAYVGLQYAVFGLILWQVTRPAPLEEDLPQNG